MSEWKNTEIGIIPKNAEVRELGDCIDLVIDHRGKTPKKLDSDWVDKGIPAISAKNIHGGRLTDKESIRYVTQEIYEQWMKEDVKKGDCFLVSEGATLGEYLYWDFDFPIVLSQRLFCIRTNPKVLYAKYFYAYVTSVNFQKQIFARATGSSVGGLRQTELLRLKIPVIPIDEQVLIGDLLYNLEKKQKALEDQNETLEQIAQTLFKHWFIDFEFPNADGKPYKLSGGAMVASELGDIPEGWKVGKLKDISDITSSKRIFSAEYVESGIPFYRSKEIIELHAGQNVTTELYISEEKFNEIKSKFEVPKADEILLTSVGTIGVPYLIKKSDQFYFKDGNLTWIKRFKNGFSGVVIYYWLKSESTQAKIKQNTIGSTQKALTIQALGNISIFIPDPKTLSRYTEFIKIVNSKIENNIYQIQTLTKTRDSLLPKLMSGQLRVKE